MGDFRYHNIVYFNTDADGNGKEILKNIPESLKEFVQPSTHFNPPEEWKNPVLVPLLGKEEDNFNNYFLCLKPRSNLPCLKEWECLYPHSYNVAPRFENFNLNAANQIPSGLQNLGMVRIDFLSF